MSTQSEQNPRDPGSNQKPGSDNGLPPGPYGVERPYEAARSHETHVTTGTSTDEMAAQSPEHLEARIEDTRHRLQQTIEELQHRLSPEDMVDQAVTYLKNNKALRHNMATAVRENPVPICLMGIGLIWLAANSLSGSRTTRPPQRLESPRTATSTQNSFDAAPLAGDPRYSDHPKGPSPQPYPSGEAARASSTAIPMPYDPTPDSPPVVHDTGAPRRTL